MEPSQPIPAREMERMMKLQDVILKAMAKKLTWIEAAEIAGMSVRNMQRKPQAHQEYGYTGLFDQRRGKRSIHRVPMETAEKVLALGETHCRCVATERLYRTSAGGLVLARRSACEPLAVDTARRRNARGSAWQSPDACVPNRNRGGGRRSRLEKTRRRRTNPSNRSTGRPRRCR